MQGTTTAHVQQVLFLCHGLGGGRVMKLGLYYLLLYGLTYRSAEPAAVPLLQKEKNAAMKSIEVQVASCSILKNR